MKLKDRVALGAKLLDDMHGKWAHMVPTESFIMKNPCKCVLHHIYNDYTDGITTLLGCDYEEINDQDSEHGFDCYNHDVDFENWESYWVDEIQLRLDNDQPTERDVNF